MTPLKIAILDQYCNHPNQGMRCIKNLVDEQLFPMDWKVFDVRSKNEIPGLEHDIYISSGGPGNPLASGGEWEKNYLKWFDSVMAHNQKNTDNKKYVFLICHSFQMVCHHLQLAEVCLRKSPAFGIFPVHKTTEGKNETVFEHLPEPFYAVDSRDWQIIRPDENKLSAMGAKLLAIEKERPHVPYERAVMSIRFSNEVLGTQFHPEADVIGMMFYFGQEEKKKQIVKNHGDDKYNDMIASLEDKDKILLTHKTIIPSFLSQAIKELRGFDSIDLN